VRRLFYSAAHRFCSRCAALILAKSTTWRASAVIWALISGAEHRPRGAGEGLGLGLYIVRQIAVAHGGSVTAATEDGTVKFTVRLPLSIAT